VVLEVEDILKEFDESIERDEKETGKVADGPGDPMETGGLKQEVIDEAKQAKEAAAEEDLDAGDAAEEADEADPAEADDEASGPGDKKKGFFKKKKKSIRALELELEKAASQALDMTDRYQRLMAEFENARKRMDKEKGQMFDIGARSVLEKLLPVVDNFERGLSALSEEEKQDPFAQGVEKIYQQLMTVLTDVGVTPIEATGTPFNPDLHNAVMHVEDEELPENVVAEEFQKGYMYKDNVLRYSMVKVAN
jgi:molecular chaperone GrpE